MGWGQKLTASQLYEAKKKLSRGNLIQKHWGQSNNLIIMYTGQNNNARCMMLLFVVFFVYKDG